MADATRSAGASAGSDGSGPGRPIKAPRARLSPRELVRRRASGTSRWTRRALVGSAAVHIVLSLFLALRLVRTPPPENEAVLYVKLEVPTPEPEQLEEAPIELEGQVEEQPEDGAPVPTEDPPDDHLETADDERKEKLARGDPSATGGVTASVEPVEAPPVFGVGGEKGGRYGWESGAGLIERSLSPGGIKGLKRLRSIGLDVVLCIDTTSSMSDTLEDDKEHARMIVETVGALVPKARFGLVEYATVLRRIEPLTFDREAIARAIRELYVVNGGDECVERALEHALKKGDLGWRTGAAKVVIVVGDEAADPTDQLRCMRVVRGAVGEDPELTVSTVSANQGSGMLVPTFGEIAAAGRGEAVSAGQEGDLARSLLRLAFGPEVGPEVERWVLENPALARRHLGFASASQMLAIGRDSRLSNAERVDALLTLLTGRNNREAKRLLLEIAVADPSVLDRVGARFWAAVGEREPSVGTAQERRDAMLDALVRAAGKDRVVESADAVAKVYERATDAKTRREALGALAKMGGLKAAETLRKAARTEPDLLDDESLLAAMMGTPDPAIRALVARRMAQNDAFRERCLASGRHMGSAMRGSLGQLLLGDDVFREKCLASDGDALRTTLDALMLDPRRGRYTVAERLVTDEGFRARALPALGIDHETTIGALLIEGLARDRVDGAAIDAADARVSVLAGLSDGVIANAFDGAFKSPSVNIDGAARALAAVGERIGAERFGDVALTLEPGPLDALVALQAREEGTGPRVLGLLAARLADASAGRISRLGERAMSMSEDVRAELALELQPTLDELSGAQRRHVFRLFAELTDDRGLPLLVDAVTWDGGKLMPEALDALSRVTGQSFKKPARSRRKRAEQALQIKWWWAKERERRGLAAR